MHSSSPSQLCPALESAQQQVVQDMQHWLEKAVIGLNLCPFAKAVHAKGQVHYVVSRARDAAELLQDLRQELEALLALPAEERDTTLLMAPWCMEDFLEFNDFVFDAETLVADLDLEGVLQVASFHPQFQFEGTDIEDIGNATNQAPYPTLHLLREESIDRAVEAYPDAEVIYERNIALLEDMGREKWDALNIERRAPLEYPEDAQ